MRLVKLATGPFAVPTLRALAGSEHELATVVTRPPRGRHADPKSPVGAAAEEMQLLVWTPETVNSPESQSRLSELAADLLVVCDYGEILKPATLATTRLGGVNLHGSLLPKYRGAAPVQWAILKGERETGNTVIQMTPALDAGPCLAQQRVAIDPEETAAELEERLSKMGAALVCNVIGQLAKGTARPIEQISAEASKAPRLKKEDGAIDWSWGAQQIKNRVRAMQPWPRAFTFWHRTEGGPLRLNIDRVAVVEAVGIAAGTVVEAKDRLVVAAGEGALEILQLQPEGKRVMSAAEFLRGHRVQVGDRMGP